jgi:hypothetical protein
VNDSFNENTYLLFDEMTFEDILQFGSREIKQRQCGW